MDFKVVITQAALNDLEEIVNFISHDNPRAAQRMIHSLLRQAESLSEMPRRGKLLRGRPGIRRLVRNPYLILYRVDEDAKAVNVLRFWHGARDSKSLRLD